MVITMLNTVCIFRKTILNNEFARNGEEIRRPAGWTRRRLYLGRYFAKAHRDTSATAPQARRGRARKLLVTFFVVVERPIVTMEGRVGA